MNKKRIVALIIACFLLYDVCTFVEYSGIIPEKKLSPEIEEIIRIEKDTETIKNKLDSEKRTREKFAEELKIWEAFQKRAEEEILETEELTLEAEKAIKKYGIRKTFKLTNTKENYEARRIICDFYHCDAKETKSNAFWGMENVFARKFDFNDDGVYEIIGSWSGDLGDKGPSMVVLQKKDDRYLYVIFRSNTDPMEPIVVLNHKTNGYYDYIYTQVTNVSSYRRITLFTHTFG